MSKLFSKLSKQQNYFLMSKSRVLEEFLKTIYTEKKQSFYMVLSINKNDNVFTELSSKSMTIQANFSALSKKGIIANIIFILSSLEDMTEDFELYLGSLKKMNISIILKKNIENDINNLEFFYTEKEDFVVIRTLRIDTPVYMLSKQKDTILESKMVYEKILKKSITYEEFLHKKERLFHYSELNKSLFGTWYLYQFRNKLLSVSNIKIISENNIVFLKENIQIKKGFLLLNKNQSLIVLEDIISNNTMLFYINNQDINSEVFSASVISKKDNYLHDSFEVALFSKKEIDYSMAIHLLNKKVLISSYPENKIVEQ